MHKAINVPISQHYLKSESYAYPNHEIASIVTRRPYSHRVISPFYLLLFLKTILSLTFRVLKYRDKKAWR
jgi:hypothetical protein